MYVYSDLKNKKNVNDPTYTKKHFYRKISIFNDNVLDKSINYLKESVLKKNQFIQEYNQSQKFLTKKLKDYENSIENKNNNYELDLNGQNAKSREIISNIALGNNNNSDFISNENKRRKKNYSLDFKNIVTIKNLEKDSVLKYDYDGIIVNSKANENSFVIHSNNNNNNDNNIFDKIMKKITSNSSYKNLTNFNYDLNKAKQDHPIKNKKNDFLSSNKISENSLDASKILDELIENIEKVYSIDCFPGIDNSNISNIFFKKINKKINKNNPNNKSKLRDESSFIYNKHNKKWLDKSNSLENTLTGDGDYNNNFISLGSQNKKHKRNKENNIIGNQSYNSSENNNNYNGNKESYKNKKDSIQKLNSMQVNNYGSPTRNNDNNKKNNLTKPPSSNNKSFFDATEINKEKENKNQESIKVKTPIKIKREMQKIFKMNKGEEFQHREVNNDPEVIKQMIIKLLSISKGDTESYKYYRDVSKSLILQMKDKMYFWKNVIDFLYPKIFKNKLSHKKTEERVLGEGLFQLNVEDLRYHKNNKALQLELRNSLYGQENADKDNEKNKNGAILNNQNFGINKNNKNNFYSVESNNADKNVKSENCVIDRDVIYRSAQQSNFTENAERLLKPSTLKKINTEKRIKLAQLSRKNQLQCESVFDSNNSNARLNFTNFNYLPRIHSNENSESRASRKNLKYMNEGDSYTLDQLQRNKRIYYSHLNNDNSNFNLNEENKTRIDNNPKIYNNNNNKIDVDIINDKSKIELKEKGIKSSNYSMISDVFLNQKNNKNFIDKAEEKQISRRFRGHHHSMDLHSELNDIYKINPPNSNFQSHLFAVPNNPNNNIVYFNSYNNESLTTNLENSSNFNVTEVDKNNNNNNTNDNNLNSGVYYNFENIVENTLNKIISNKKLVKINHNYQIEGRRKNNLIDSHSKNDKNTFNKLTKNKKIYNATEIKTSNLNSDFSKISITIPYTVNSASLNTNFNSNHYENFKKNNKKDSKAFKVIAPMLISSIPKYDL